MSENVVSMRFSRPVKEWRESEWEKHVKLSEITLVIYSLDDVYGYNKMLDAFHCARLDLQITLVFICNPDKEYNNIFTHFPPYVETLKIACLMSNIDFFNSVMDYMPASIKNLTIANPTLYYGCSEIKMLNILPSIKSFVICTNSNRYREEETWTDYKRKITENLGDMFPIKPKVEFRHLHVIFTFD